MLSVELAGQLLCRIGSLAAVPSDSLDFAGASNVEGECAPFQRSSGKIPRRTCS
jgi:hypothetical protein